MANHTSVVDRVRMTALRRSKDEPRPRARTRDGVDAMRALLLLSISLTLQAALAAQSTWYVDPAGSDTNPGTAPGPASAFRTVNHANSIAAAGDVVRLAAATFGPEQGVIVLGDKDLMLIGAGAAQTCLKAHPTLTVNVNRGFPASPVPTQQRPVVLVEGPGNVRFRGVTFDGDFQVPPTGFLIGVIYRDGADGTLEDCVIRNCRADPVTSSSAPAGLVVRGDDSMDPCLVTLRDCAVYDFGKVGVVSFFRAEVNLVDNVIRGAGPDSGAPPQIGVQISFDAQGSVRRTTITDLYFTGSSTVAAGIITYDAGDAVLDDNHIGNCEQGIFCTHTSSNSMSVVIRENEIHNAEAAISLENIDSAQVIGNRLQLRSDAFTQAAYDDTAGHQWSNNSYSTYSEQGPHPIPGIGGNVDPNPGRGIDLLSGPTNVAALTATSPPVAIVTASLRDVPGIAGDDFAVVHEDLSISVGLNANGGFTTTTLPPLLANHVAVDVVRGVFDAAPGDDLAVLAVDAATQASVVIILNNDRAGGFTPAGAVTLTGLPNATDLASGDLVTGNGSDLVVSSASGAASLLTNNGAGAFVQSALPGTSATPVAGLAVGVFNDDNLLDVAVLAGDATAGELTVLTGDGAGGFTALPPRDVPAHPQTLAAGDLDGDGDDDLVAGFGDRTATVGAILGSMTVLENEGANTFRLSVYPADRPVTALTVGDLDDDSTLGATFGDVAAVSPSNSTLSVFGGFRRGAGFGDGGITTTGAAPTAVAFGDFEGDALQDLLFIDAAGKVVTLRGAVQARVDRIGVGCAGSAARIPQLDLAGYPAILPTSTALPILMSEAIPTGIGILAVGAGPPPLLLPCFPQIDVFSLITLEAGITDPSGRFLWPFVLPTSLDTLGAPIYFAGAVVDPSAPSFLNIINISLTKGLKVRIGR